MAGDEDTAICIMKMDEGIDTGDILAKKTIKLDPKYTSGIWAAKAADIGSKMMLEVLDNIDNIIPIKQTEDEVTYAHKLTKEEALIDWQKPAIEIQRLIRGLNPWPIAYFKYLGENIKIYEAEIIDQSGIPGTILDDKLTIACYDQAIRPTLLQRPSRKIMTREELQRGYNIPLGTCFNATI
jgi:methionyl-tRNA formyltransferase